MFSVIRLRIWNPILTLTKGEITVSSLFSAIGSIISVGAVYVLLPNYLSVFFGHRKPKRIMCPERGEEATVSISPHLAALTSLFDSEKLRLKRCSLWSEGKSCDVGCLKNLRKRL
jgi:hypothetical protein